METFIKNSVNIFARHFLFLILIFKNYQFFVIFFILDGESFGIFTFFYRKLSMKFSCILIE